MIYRWLCKECGQETDVERPISDCGIPPGECPPWHSEHISDWQRIYEAPMITKESYPDGHKRKGWAEMREARQLEKQAAVTKDRGTRRQMAAEIQKMGVKGKIT